MGAEGNYRDEHLPLGWECPKCGAVYNPEQMVCLNCTPRIVPGIGTTPLTPWYQNKLCPYCGRYLCSETHIGDPPPGTVEFTCDGGSQRCL